MLLWAAYHGQTEVVKTFLMVGGNCEQPKNGNSPLQWAAMRGHADIVKVLAAAGAKLEHENQDGNTALLLGARHGHAQVVKALLAAGANVEHRNKEGKTALMLAQDLGFDDVAEALLAIRSGGKSGLDASTVCEEDSSKNSKRMKASESSSEAKGILEDDEDAKSLLWKASLVGDTEQVERLLTTNPLILNEANSSGWTALMYAAWKRHLEILKLLIASEADLELKTHDGNTALILTACVGDVQAINLLVSSGADLERTSQTGFSPLLCASEKGHLDAVIALVDAGSYLLHRNNEGKTALDLAQANGHGKIVEFLSSKMKESNEANFESTKEAAVSKGQLWESAALGDFEQTKGIVTAKPSIIDEQDESGWTALLWAAYKGHSDTVKVLIDAGAYLKHRDSNGRTALDLAREEGHQEVMEILSDKSNESVLRDSTMEQEQMPEEQKLSVAETLPGEQAEETVEIEVFLVDVSSKRPVGVFFAEKTSMRNLLLEKLRALMLEELAPGCLPLDWIFFKASRGEFLAVAKTQESKVQCCRVAESRTDGSMSLFVGINPISPSTSPIAAPSSLRTDEWKSHLKEQRNSVLRIEEKDVEEDSIILGRGATKLVRQGFWKEKQVAIVEVLVDDSQMDLIERELALYQCFKGHPNIVSLFGIVSDTKWVMEFCEWKLSSSKWADFKQRLKWALDISHGLTSLHAFNLSHGDLKPDNVLIHEDEDGSRTAKLIDFGSALRVEASVMSKRLTAGTGSFTAPEASDGQEGFDRAAADIYSLGRVFLEMFSSQKTARTGGSGALARVDQYFVEVKQPVFAESIKKLIQDCTQEDPKKRCHLKQVCSVLESLLQAAGVELSSSPLISRLNGLMDKIDSLGDDLERNQEILKFLKAVEYKRIAES